MWQKISKKFRLNNYKRYFFVLILFVLVFIFGKNMDILTPEQKQLQDQAYAQKKITLGIYDVPADQNQSKIIKLFSIQSGQCGRLFFNLRSLPTGGNLNNQMTENPKFKILLSNDFDQNQEIGSYELKNNRYVQNEEASFCANSAYQNLLFIKDKNSEKSSFEISNVSYYPIAIEKRDFAGLMAPIMGNTNFNNVIYQSSFGFGDANKSFRFSRKNQEIGQTFIADSDTISGVDLKMEFTGVGGMGNYSLELRDISVQSGRLVLSSEKIAYFQFNKDIAEKDLKVDEDIYHIPLAAHLDKGRTYFIGISNEEVKFNVLNTLKIYGKDAGNGEKIVYSVRGKTSEKSGNLYLKVFGADFQKNADNRILTGAKILDNGDGSGLYTYEQKGNFSDFLDIEQLISNKNSNIFYDNVQSGISANDKNGNAFVYKINTIYPFSKMKIEAEQPSGEFTNSLVYYSFDNENWQEIKSDWNEKVTSLQEDKNKFHELLESSENKKNIYIKITYDRVDAQEKNTHLFGLKNLKINAELKIN